MHAMSSNGEIVNKWRRCKYINEILKGNEKERTAAAWWRLFALISIVQERETRAGKERGEKGARWGRVVIGMCRLCHSFEGGVGGVVTVPREGRSTRARDGGLSEPPTRKSFLFHWHP
jgi:hypothetical protein